MSCTATKPSGPASPGVFAVRSLVLPVLLGLLLGASPSPAPAQDQAAAPPSADPADVGSPEAIVAAVYDVISGPAGQARNWNRFLSLFLPEARLVSVGVDREGGVSRRVMTPGEYRAAAAASLEGSGFFEEEIGHLQEEFGPVVHRFSAYQSRRSQDDAEPFARGINSFQLLHDGSRWWVLTIFWTQERPDLPIPSRYLGETRTR
jgi:hypothetical protein